MNISTRLAFDIHNGRRSTLVYSLQLPHELTPSQHPLSMRPMLLPSDFVSSRSCTSSFSVSVRFPRPSRTSHSSWVCILVLPFPCYTKPTPCILDVPRYMAPVYTTTVQQCIVPSLRLTDSIWLFVCDITFCRSTHEGGAKNPGVSSGNFVLVYGHLYALRPLPSRLAPTSQRTRNSRR
jgi:hypothetical protein